MTPEAVSRGPPTFAFDSPFYSRFDYRTALIQKAGFDLIWFGIFIVLLVEIAEVTPPVGFNLFVLQNMTGKDSKLIAKAAIPFFICMVVCIALITAFPQIVTSLPDLVMGKEK